MPGEDRPKRLYINVPLSPDDMTYLISRGWDPTDVRVLPNKTDAQKADTLKAWLEGVRQGSIIVDKDIIKLIELEAKAYGLVGTKTIEKPKEETPDSETVDELLEMFASKRVLKKKANTKSAGPKGGHPFTHSNAPMNYTNGPPLTGIFDRKNARRFARSIVKGSKENDRLREGNQ